MPSSDTGSRRIVFPFTAIVGLDKAKLALLVIAVNPSIGGVLLRGDKGTGKTTLVRALANVLPEIEVVADCPFNCNPRNPLEMCDNCYRRWSRGEQLPVKKKKMKVVDLPLSITPDRLIGTIDFEKALKEGVRILKPGLLAEANRNILYIDEVNLLDDYIADLILDAAAYGWNIVEREHVSFKHPARFILVGSMNPEEGELRPQLLDRFGIVVDVEAPSDPEMRAEIIRRVEEFHQDPVSFYKKYEILEKQLTMRIEKARNLLPKTTIDDDLLKLVAKTIVELKIKTCRAEITAVKVAKAIATLDGRTRVTLEDVKKAFELTLPHRLRLQPLQQQVHQQIDKVIEKILEKHFHNNEHDKQHKQSSRSNQEGDSKNNNGDTAMGLGENTIIIPPSNSDHPVLLEDTRMGRIREVTDHLNGSRSTYTTVVNKPYGTPIAYIYPWINPRDIDLVGTITNMLANRLVGIAKVDKALDVMDDLVAVRVRRQRIPQLTIIALDASGSMNLAKRIAIAKSVAQQIVEKEYTKKTWLSLITFRSNGVDKYIPPTKNYTKVYKEITETSSGGRTPLPTCLQKILETTKSFRTKHRGARVKAILVTDGKANKSIRTNIEEEITILSKQMASQGIETIIYETTSGLSPGKTYTELIARITNAKIYRL